LRTREGRKEGRGRGGEEGKGRGGRGRGGREGEGEGGGLHFIIEVVHNVIYTLFVFYYAFALLLFYHITYLYFDFIILN